GLGEDVRPGRRGVLVVLGLAGALGLARGRFGPARARRRRERDEQDEEKRADPAPAHFCSLRTSPATRICGSTSGFSACSSETVRPVSWAIEVSVSPLCTV